MGKAAGNSIAQIGFRGRNDDGSETGAAWIADTNSNWEQRPDRNFRVRLLLDRSSGLAASFAIYLYYSHNGGPFTSVDGVSSVVRAKLSNFYANGDPTTQQIGSGNFIATNEAMVEGLGGSNTINFPSVVLDEIEIEWCLQIVGDDVLDKDSVELRGQVATAAFTRGYLEILEITVYAPRTIRRTIFIE